MPARTSKEVTDLQKACLFLLSALMRQGEWVADKLLGLVGPHLEEGDVEPGFFPVIVALARNLRASLDRLVAADEAVYAANVRLGWLRDRRGALFSQLARKVARLRLTLINQFVAPRLDDLGFEDETARSPVPLLRQADRIAEVFRGEGLEELLGEPVFEQPVDLRSQVSELAPTADELRETLDDVDDARRRFDEVQVTKDQTMEEHGSLFLRTARSFEDLCRIAGEDELADRVRPSEKRPGQTAQQKPPAEGESAEGAVEAKGTEDAPDPSGDQVAARRSGAEPATDAAPA